MHSWAHNSNFKDFTGLTIHIHFTCNVYTRKIEVTSKIYSD